MKPRIPPRLASWLLAHLDKGPFAEALAGDLVEEFQTGRSAAWYWRQIALAILIARTRFLRRLTLSLLDAGVAAFAMMALGIGTVAWAAAAIHPAPRPPSECHSSHRPGADRCIPPRRDDR